LIQSPPRVCIGQGSSNTGDNIAIRDHTNDHHKRGIDSLYVCVSLNVSIAYSGGGSSGPVQRYYVLVGDTEVVCRR
jgi:hypothetical protein